MNSFIEGCCYHASFSFCAFKQFNNVMINLDEAFIFNSYHICFFSHFFPNFCLPHHFASLSNAKLTKRHASRTGISSGIWSCGLCQSFAMTSLLKRLNSTHQLWRSHSWHGLVCFQDSRYFNLGYLHCIGQTWLSLLVAVECPHKLHD